MLSIQDFAFSLASGLAPGAGEVAPFVGVATGDATADALAVALGLDLGLDRAGGPALVDACLFAGGMADCGHTPLTWPPSSGLTLDTNH